MQGNRFLRAFERRHQHDKEREQCDQQEQSQPDVKAYTPEQFAVISSHLRFTRFLVSKMTAKMMTNNTTEIAAALPKSLKAKAVL
ncbi:hypothetical protein D3C75_534540 [compost metagenome]